MIKFLLWVLSVFVTLTLYFSPHLAYAETVAQGRSTEGFRVRLTTDRCTKESGRERQLQWGRVFAWQSNGQTITGCGKLDYDTVVVEWLTPNGIDERRYDATLFTWKPGYGR